MKFKVGKKYSPHYNGQPRCDVIYECVFVSGGQAVLKRPEGSIFISFMSDSEYYSEYVEPKKGVLSVNILEYTENRDKPTYLSYAYESREKADKAASKMAGKRMACIELEWTEGQGLDV